MANSIATMSAMLTANANSFSQTMRRSKKEIEEVNAAVEKGDRSFKTYYATQQRAASRGNEEQRVRNAMAEQIKGMREQALQARVTAEAQKRLFGGDPAAAAEVRSQVVGETAKTAQASALTFREQYKKYLGEESDFMRFGRMALGAGVLAEVANRIAAAAAKAKELAVAFQLGEITGKELTASMLRAIPIAGQLGGAIDDIRQALSGEAAELARLENSIKINDLITDGLKARIALHKELARSYRDYIQQLADESARQNKPGLTPLYERAWETRDRLKTIEDRRTELLESTAVAKQKELINKISQDLHNAQAAEPGWWETSGMGSGEYAAEQRKKRASEIANQQGRLNSATATLKAMQEEIEGTAKKEKDATVAAAKKGWGYVWRDTRLYFANGLLEMRQAMQEKQREAVAESLRANTEKFKTQSQAWADTERQRRGDLLKRQEEQTQKFAEKEASRNEEMQNLINGPTSQADQLMDEFNKLSRWIGEGHGSPEAEARLVELKQQLDEMGNTPRGRLDALMGDSGAAVAQRYQYEASVGLDKIRDQIPQAQLKEQKKIAEYSKQMAETTQQLLDQKPKVISFN